MSSDLIKKRKEYEAWDSENEIGGVNVGGYSLEEKLVSAVWVHERIRNRMTWCDLIKNFRIRFEKNPPTRRTLQFWERKLFDDGSVHDKIRTGRPCSRLMHVPYVKASLIESPNLSLRERALELGLPRTTLCTILKDDLKMTFEVDAEATTNGKRKKSAISQTSGLWRRKETDDADDVNMKGEEELDFQ